MLDSVDLFWYQLKRFLFQQLFLMPALQCLSGRPCSGL